MPRGYLKRCKDVTRKARRGGSSHTSNSNKNNKGRSIFASWDDSCRKHLVRQEQTRIQGHIDDSLFFDGFDTYYEYNEYDDFQFEEQQESQNAIHTPAAPTPNKLNNNNNNEKCAICLEENKPLIQLMKNCCHASACKTCLRELYIHQAQQDVNNYPLKCFHYQCNLLVTETQLQNYDLIQSPQELTKHYRLCVLAKAYRMGSKSVAHCPVCDHPQMIRQSTDSITCKNCFQKFEVDQGKSTDRLTIRYLETFKRDGIGENDGWAQCPRCDIVISKGYGCDHMICACGQNFSWAEAREVARKKFEKIKQRPIVKPSMLPGK